MEEKTTGLFPQSTETLPAPAGFPTAMNQPPGNLPAGKDGEAETRAAEDLRRLLPKAAMKMEEMLDSPTVPTPAKIRIIEIILERTLGKAETAVRLNGSPETMEEALEHIEAIFAAMRVKKGIK